MTDEQRQRHIEARTRDCVKAGGDEAACRATLEQLDDDQLLLLAASPLGLLRIIAANR